MKQLRNVPIGTLGKLKDGIGMEIESAGFAFFAVQLFLSFVLWGFIQRQEWGFKSRGSRAFVDLQNSQGFRFWDI